MNIKESVFAVIALAIALTGCEAEIPTFSAELALRGERPYYPDSGAIDGRVIPPVSGAQVIMQRTQRVQDDPEAWQALRRETTTDGSGRYRIDGLIEGSYHVVAHVGTLAGYSLISYPFDSENFARNHVYLDSAERVSGVVQSPDGKPVPNAGVGIAFRHAHSVVREGNTYPAFASPLLTTTDANGRFVIDHVIRPKVKLFAEAKGYCRSTTDWVDVPSQECLITMAEGGHVSGQVMHATSGLPIPDQRLFLFSREQGSNVIGEGLTDTDGRFDLKNVVPGSYQVLLRGLTYAFPTAEPVAVMVREGIGAKSLSIEVVETGTIGGRIYDPDTGLGIEGAIVTATVLGRPLNLGKHTTTSDADGQYRIDGIPPGLGYLRYTPAPGYPRKHNERRWTLKPGQTLSDQDFTLVVGARIEGRVVDPSGAPIPCVGIVGKSDSSAHSIQHDISDNDGSFVLAGYRPGDTVTLSINSHAKLIFYTHECFIAGGPPTLRVPADARAEAVEVVVPLESRVEGRVLDANHNPIEDAIVIANTFDGDTLARSKPTDKDGGFHLRGLEGKTFYLQAKSRLTKTPADLAPQVKLGWGEECTVDVYIKPPTTEARSVIPVSLPPAPADVSQERGLAISGQVTDAEGSPLYGIHVFAEYVEDRNAPVHEAATTDADGKYIIKNLPPEYEYEVTAQANSVRGLIRPTRTAVSAGSRDINFELKPVQPGQDPSPVIGPPRPHPRPRIDLERAGTAVIGVVSGLEEDELASIYFIPGEHDITLNSKDDLMPIREEATLAARSAIASTLGGGWFQRTGMEPGVYTMLVHTQDRGDDAFSFEGMRWTTQTVTVSRAILEVEVDLE